MRPDRIDHRGLLANEQMTGAMEHQAALLLRRLGHHEPHVGPGDRLADGLSVGSIVLLSLDVRLDVGWWHQGEPYDQEPAVRATNDGMRRRLQCQRRKAAASGRMAKRSGA